MLTGITKDADRLRAHGGVDILLNLACTYLDDDMFSSRAQWIEALNVNVVSPALFVRTARSYLIERGGGAIVNCTFITAKVAQTGCGLHPVSKAATLPLVGNMAMDRPSQSETS